MNTHQAFAIALIMNLSLASAPVLAKTNIKTDALLEQLKSTPTLELILQWRQQAPYDFRVLPYAYEWGRIQLKRAQGAYQQKHYAKAQQLADEIWLYAALTPGLEEFQKQLDEIGRQPTAPAAPSAAELASQRKLAQQAAAEKARVEAERKKAAIAARKAEEDAKRQAEAQRQAKLKAEAERRQLAAAEAARRKAEADKKAQALWRSAKENSPALASFELSSEQIRQRSHAINAELEPICQAIIDQDASVVLHTANKADYRWLTVRLTLCLRQINADFRLRHSYQASTAAPVISLHHARDESLVRQAADS